MSAGELGPSFIGGRYFVRDILASGGMGEVRFGEFTDSSGVRQVVAIKCVKPEFAGDAEFVAMLRDEAHIVSAISHSNVAAVLDVVEEPSGLYLVMEYIHGETLSKLVAASRARGATLPRSVSLAIVVDMLEGLHAAHEARSQTGVPLEIVHRDVSPQNVIVGADGVSRVLDFGIAKAITRSRPMTDGSLRGRISYMAPEHLAGSATRASDVYSAAVVLWELLAGRRYFEGLEAQEMIEQATNVPPKSLRAVAPTIEPALEALVLRGLAKDVNTRFASAREMAIALRAEGPIASRHEVSKVLAATAGQNLMQRAMLNEAPIAPQISPMIVSTGRRKANVFVVSTAIAFALTVALVAAIRYFFS